MLASRIDRLPPAEKDLLQSLAVIGREFPLGLVKQLVSKADDELEEMLSHLQATELIYEQLAHTDVTYIFKHALSQQVAYGSALLERRRIMHQRIAGVLEAQFPDTVKTQPELIAHHYTEAGLGTRAIPYWQSAGERNRDRFANVEAIHHLSKALELLEAIPKDSKRRSQVPTDEAPRCTLLLALGEAQRMAGEHLSPPGGYVGGGLPPVFMPGGIGWMMIAIGKRAGVMRLTWSETTSPPTGDPVADLSPLLYHERALDELESERKSLRRP